MVKKIIGICVIVILLLGIASWQSFHKKQLAVSAQGVDFAQQDFTINGKTYHLFVADNETKWERGLMYFRSLYGVDGMMFLFPNKQIRTFWNKNTFMNLQVLWLNDAKVVGKSNLPSIEQSKHIVLINSPQPINRVVELVHQ